MAWLGERDGFAVVEGVLSAAQTDVLLRFVEEHAKAGQGRGGVSNLLRHVEMQELATSDAVRKLVQKALGLNARPVRGILFDKSADANWKVPWHQDVTIAVSGRTDAAGYGAWSTKEGVLHVQPPHSVLERMISVRIHLDDCAEENGALRVLPGSHVHGKLSAEETSRWVEHGGAVVCPVRRGGVLMMRPLLLHASSAASVAGHRRVLHFDFAVGGLAADMGWAADFPGSGPAGGE